MPPDAPPRAPSAALRLDIDREVLAANWRALDRLSGKARAGAAVKADGYGLGARRVTTVLRDAGCRDFFVAHWGEAAELLDVTDAGTVSVLHGPLTDADAAFARATGIRPVINSLEQAHRWLAGGGGRCDLMVDTGMNRLGVPLADIGHEVLRRLDIDVLLSHLCSAEEDVPLNAHQLAGWRQACGELPHRRASLANSAGIALGPDFHGDLTRPGLSLYGGVQREALRGVIGQVVRPAVALLQIRTIAAGETVGYNATFTAPQAMRVGTVALGYADGYLRCWSGKGAMLSAGRRLPVLGRVSMDLTIIDLGEAPDLAEGDWLEVDYALDSAAAASGLSPYELLTLLGRRFSR